LCSAVYCGTAIFYPLKESDCVKHPNVKYDTFFGFFKTRAVCGIFKGVKSFYGSIQCHCEILCHGIGYLPVVFPLKDIHRYLQDGYLFF